MNREKVIAELTMLVDRKNDDTCEGLKCCKIAEDALALLKEQEEMLQSILREKNNELNSKMTALQIETQNKAIRAIIQNEGEK